MKRTIKTITVFLLAVLPMAISAQSAIEGTYKTIDDKTGEVKSHVVIYTQNGKAYGKITKLIRKPSENQDPVCDKCKGWRKDKKIIGMQIMQDLKPEGNKWKGGTIVDPKNGKTYGCEVEPVNGGKQLRVRGYLGVSALGRTQTWHKLD